LPVPLQNQSLPNIGKVVQLLFHQFGIDVFSAGAQDHVFGSALQVDEAVFVQSADVAGVQPAVHQGFRRGFGVVVIAAEHLVAFEHHLSRDVLRIRRQNLALHSVHDLAAGFKAMVEPIGIGDQGPALCHAVADGKRKLDLLHEEFHFRVHRRAARDQFHNVSAESGHQLVVDFLQDHVFDKRNLEQGLDLPAFHLRLQLALVDLFDQQGNGQHHIGFEILQGVEQQLGGWNFIQEVDVIAARNGVEQVKRAGIGMGDGQEGKDVGADLETQFTHGKIYISKQGAMGQHHAFGKAGGAGGVNDRRYILVVTHIRGRESRRAQLEQFRRVFQGWQQFLLVVHPVDEQAKIFQSKNILYLAQLVFIDRFKSFLADKQQFRVGVVYDVLRILRGETGHDWHDGAAVGNGGKPGQSPGTAVFAHHGDLGTLFHATGLIQPVQPHDPPAGIAIAHGFSRIVG